VPARTARARLFKTHGQRIEVGEEGIGDGCADLGAGARDVVEVEPAGEDAAAAERLRRCWSPRTRRRRHPPREVEL